MSKIRNLARQCIQQIRNAPNPHPSAEETAIIESLQAIINDQDNNDEKIINAFKNQRAGFKELGKKKFGFWWGRKSSPFLNFTKSFIQVAEDLHKKNLISLFWATSDIKGSIEKSIEKIDPDYKKENEKKAEQDLSKKKLCEVEQAVEKLHQELTAINTKAEMCLAKLKPNYHSKNATKKIATLWPAYLDEDQQYQFSQHLPSSISGLVAVGLEPEQRVQFFEHLPPHVDFLKLDIDDIDGLSPLPETKKKAETNFRKIKRLAIVWPVNHDPSEVAKVISGLSSLEYLELSNQIECRLYRAAGVQNLLKAARCQHLDLSHNQLGTIIEAEGDDFLTAISPEVTYLDFSFNMLGGRAPSSPLSKIPPTVTHLVLSINDIAPDYNFALAALHPTVTYLELRTGQAVISEKDLTQALQAIPPTVRQVRLATNQLIYKNSIFNPEVVARAIWASGKQCIILDNDQFGQSVKKALEEYRAVFLKARKTEVEKKKEAKEKKENRPLIPSTEATPITAFFSNEVYDDNATRLLFSYFPTVTLMNPREQPEPFRPFGDQLTLPPTSPTTAILEEKAHRTEDKAYKSDHLPAAACATGGGFFAKEKVVPQQLSKKESKITNPLGSP